MKELLKRIGQIIKNKLSNKPKKIPSKLLSKFTLGGKINVVYKFRDDSYSDKNAKYFSNNLIQRMVESAKRKKGNYYGETDSFLFDAMDKYQEEIVNKEVVDMGSVTGWYSSVALAYGAKKSYIIEYNKIISDSDLVVPIKKEDFKKIPRKFDVATSISSFEHDGLGRYGDPIDPEGDLIAMREMKKILKKGGILFLSVPIGKDTVVWNLHRIYGKIRFPKLIDGWELIDSFGFNFIPTLSAYSLLLF